MTRLNISLLLPMLTTLKFLMLNTSSVIVTIFSIIVTLLKSDINFTRDLKLKTPQLIFPPLGLGVVQLDQLWICFVLNCVQIYKHKSFFIFIPENIQWYYFKKGKLEKFQTHCSTDTDTIFSRLGKIPAIYNSSIKPQPVPMLHLIGHKLPVWIREIMNTAKQQHLTSMEYSPFTTHNS